MNFEDHEFDSCAVCYDDIDESNFVLYRMIKDDNDNDNKNWQPLMGCKLCVETFLSTQWNNYLERIKKADCAAEMRGLLKNGPPINLRCSDFIQDIDPTSEFHELYIDGKIQSAKLNGSLIGEERDLLIEKQKSILAFLESNEGKKLIENSDKANI